MDNVQKPLNELEQLIGNAPKSTEAAQPSLNKERVDQFLRENFIQNIDVKRAWSKNSVVIAGFINHETKIDYLPDEMKAKVVKDKDLYKWDGAPALAVARNPKTDLEAVKKMFEAVRENDSTLQKPHWTFNKTVNFLVKDKPVMDGAILNTEGAALYAEKLHQQLQALEQGTEVPAEAMFVVSLPKAPNGNFRGVMLRSAGVGTQPITAPVSMDELKNELLFKGIGAVGVEGRPEFQFNMKAVESSSRNHITAVIKRASTQNSAVNKLSKSYQAGKDLFRGIATLAIVGKKDLLEDKGFTYKVFQPGPLATETTDSANVVVWYSEECVAYRYTSEQKDANGQNKTIKNKLKSALKFYSLSKIENAETKKIYPDAVEKFTQRAILGGAVATRVDIDEVSSEFITGIMRTVVNAQNEVSKGGVESFLSALTKKINGEVGGEDVGADLGADVPAEPTVEEHEDKKGKKPSKRDQ